MSQSASRVASRFLAATVGYRGTWGFLSTDPKETVLGAWVFHLRQHLNGHPGTVYMNGRPKPTKVTVAGGAVDGDARLQLVGFAVPEVGFVEYDHERRQVRVLSRSGSVMAYENVVVRFELSTSALKEAGKNLAYHAAILLSDVKRGTLDNARDREQEARDKTERAEREREEMADRAKRQKVEMAEQRKRQKAEMAEQAERARKEEAERLQRERALAEISGGGSGYKVTTEETWENDPSENDYGLNRPWSGSSGKNTVQYGTLQDVLRGIPSPRSFDEAKANPKAVFLSRHKTQSYNLKTQGIYGLKRDVSSYLSIERSDGQPFTDAEFEYLKKNVLSEVR